LWKKDHSPTDIYFKMKISVYITSYNQKAYLKEAIDSVLNQTFPPFEIIIVDDNSSDGSQELIKSYANKHSKIKYHFNSINQGVAAVRTKAISMVEGDYISYVDGDDLYLPNKLDIESNIIRSESKDIVFSNNYYVSEDDVNDIKWIWASDEIDLISVPMFVKTIMRDFPRKSLFRMELMSTALLKKVGSHDKNLRIYEDYDIRIRLAKEGLFGYSLVPTTKIRISKNGLSKLSETVHQQSFNYIFNKYEEDISLLPEAKQKLVRERIAKFTKVESPISISKPTMKSRLKKKAITLINKL